LTVMGGLGKIKYNFIDSFTADISAGSVNNTLSSDGNATRTVVDTNNKISIGSGVLSFATGGVANNGLWYSVQTRIVGLAFIGRLILADTTSFCTFGLDNNQSGDVYDYVSFRTGVGIQVQSDGGAARTITSYTNTTYDLILVCRASGMYYFIKGGAETSWRLLWVSKGGTHNVYPCTTILNTVTIYTADNFKVARLTSPFNSEYGFASTVLGGERAEGNTFTHEGNCIVEWTATTIADSQYVYIRGQDATNYWKIGVNANGSMTLQEVVAGSATSRATAASGSIANGDRVVVIANGTNILVFVNNVIKLSYASATNFATATNGKLLALGSGGAISTIVSYPLTMATGVQSLFDKLTNP